MTIDELQMRRALCQAAIQTLDQVDDTDPRKAGALNNYKGQLAELDRRIAELTGTPPPVVVGLKSATLTGITNG